MVCLLPSTFMQKHHEPIRHLLLISQHARDSRKKEAVRICRQGSSFSCSSASSCRSSYPWACTASGHAREHGGTRETMSPPETGTAMSPLRLTARCPAFCHLSLACHTVWRSTGRTPSTDQVCTQDVLGLGFPKAKEPLAILPASLSLIAFR